MPKAFSNLTDLLTHAADTLIDVRSPAEFAEDHVPGAVNLPALSNDERAQVGTVYVQDSAFKARKMGAAMVARNVARHLEGPLASKEGGWQPLVYCWRGGQRSGSFASILSQIGWRAETIAGGYQSYRRLVVRLLHETPLPYGLILLDGNTGTGKTAILNRLSTMGVQTLDLEACANHRGSLLGDQPGGQPSQKMFETRIAEALVRCDPSRPIVVEAESSKIGQLNLPSSLWGAMCQSPRIMVEASINARATFLARDYADLMAKPEVMRATLAPLRRLRGHAVVDQWEALLADGDAEALARALIVQHYDPAYAKARAHAAFDLCGSVVAEALDEAGLDRAASDVATLVNQAGRPAPARQSPGQ